MAVLQTILEKLRKNKMPTLLQHTNTNLQKIKELLLNSDLTLQERDNLLTLFSETKDANLEPVVKLFSKDPNWIKKINENYKKKQAAITIQSLELWQKVVQEEESQLKELDQ